MTEKEAHLILAGPLRFGDNEQVDALVFLRQLAAARDRIARCKRCDGEGLNRDGYACAWCAAHYEPDILHALGINAQETPP